ncbi:MAG: hypothetical protein K9I94_01850 [Bacteroidales bacterium]|nr:hypothetical protein [Bacteroidales bacterium]
MRSYNSKVLNKRFLTDNTFVLRLERHDMAFHAGQYIVVGLGNDSREYSIYSGEEDPYLEILVRRVEKGNISEKLSRLKEGDIAHVEGPYGFFVMNIEKLQEKKLIFMATGTGIAPFRSFVKSKPNLNYQLLHGTRYTSEAYDHDAFDPERLIFCTTRENGSQYQGRITDYFKTHMQPDENAIYYLCGNSQMIEEMAAYLEDYDIDPFYIRTEEFF